MQIDQSLIYIIILLFTTLTIFMIGIIYAYLGLMKRYINLKEGKDKYPDPKILLLRAHAKSQKLIEEATDKAKQIVASADTLKVDNINVIQKQIEKAQLENLKIYQQSVTKIQNDSIKVLQNVPEYIKTLLMKEVLIVKDDVLAEIKSASKDAKAVVEQVYKKADSEVAEYKKVRISALDEIIVNIVQQVSRKVLNREIDVSEHEKLVIKALEEAKRQNIFSESDDQEGDVVVDERG